tara:strand:- start:7802 stop:8041 length:240 start_codon:yes stop_codon:yes gene_type:complete
MTMTQRLRRATVSGSINAYSSVMEEISNWTCKQQPGGIAWVDPCGDQSGDLFESFEDLVGETYNILEGAAEMIDQEVYA